MVVVYENEEPGLPPPLKDMLDKLIQACKFQAEEVLHVNYKFNRVKWSMIAGRETHPEIMLIFGAISISKNLAHLNKNLPYTIGGIKVLRTENLQKLEEIKAEKSAFWAVLKPMVNQSE